jgi:hypothetical protein
VLASAIAGKLCGDNASGTRRLSHTWVSWTSGTRSSRLNEGDGFYHHGWALVRLATVALEEFSAHNVELFDTGAGAQLRADLRHTQIIEKSYGQRLAAKRSNSAGHANAGTAFLLALASSRDFTEPIGDAFVEHDRPLVW